MKDVYQDLTHVNCRAKEFVRWPRVALEHEREHLSRIMGTSCAFISYEEQCEIMHELMDIDYFLSLTKPKIEVPKHDLPPL